MDVVTVCVKVDVGHAYTLWLIILLLRVAVVIFQESSCKYEVTLLGDHYLVASIILTILIGLHVQGVNMSVQIKV